MLFICNRVSFLLLGVLVNMGLDRETKEKSVYYRSLVGLPDEEEH